MKKQLLIVDDNEEFRRLVKIFLSKEYDVESFENGMQALAFLQKGILPDLIVSDLNMPELDGKTLLDQLKSSEVFKHIPVIILSSIDKSSERVELIKSGASDYLSKPFNPEELNVRIENQLRKTV
ncbi:MAG: response regulator transcription factor [Salinivirgaceae bacterium]|nr:response regulator transcription factor [Salinivirgaceae bacterium]